jgi:excisionase family DNA binding protein
MLNKPGHAHTVREAATILGVHPETLRRGIRRGDIKAIHTSAGRGGGGYRIPADEVERLLSTVFATGDSNKLANPLELRARGKYLLRVGDRTGARRCYEDALRASRSLNDELGEAKATYKLGQIASKDGRYTDAEQAYRSALAIFEQKDPAAVEALHLALGDLAFKRNDVDRVERLRQAARYYTDIVTPSDGLVATERGRSVASRGLARVALERGDTASAEKHVNAAYEIAATYEDPPMKADVMVSMGELDEHRGLRGLAIERLERAIVTYEGFGFRDRATETREKVERLKHDLKATSKIKATSTTLKPPSKKKRKPAISTRS